MDASTAGMFVYDVHRRLKLMYHVMKGEDVELRSGDSEFVRDVHKCVLLFDEMVPRAPPYQFMKEWRPREVSQDAAEQAIDGEVRAMVEKYIPGLPDGVQKVVQQDFDILVELVQGWSKPTQKPKKERIQEILVQMRRLITELWREVEAK
jgi:hypothetical protein